MTARRLTKDEACAATMKANPLPKTRAARFWRWVRRQFFGTGCSCGGEFFEFGTSGFTTCTVHEVCNWCGTTRETLLEH